MILLNGERRQCIDVSDRGFQYGDGLFETIEVVDGKPLFLNRHLERLAAGCRRLLIPMPDLAILVEEASKISSSSKRAVLKLIVTRGSGGRGYRQPAEISPTRLFSIHPFPEYPACLQTEGIRARFCDLRLAANPALAGIKHMNRLEQILARAEWQDDSVQEGLMLDCDGHVIEGTMTNLFMVKQGEIYTPVLAECGVIGVVRQIVIELAARDGLTVNEAVFDKDVLLDADEIFVTNSVIGIWPVKQLEGKTFKVGPLTRMLQRHFDAERNLESRS